MHRKAKINDLFTKRKRLLAIDRSPADREECTSIPITAHLQAVKAHFRFPDQNLRRCAFRKTFEFIDLVGYVVTSGAKRPDLIA